MIYTTKPYETKHCVYSSVILQLGVFSTMDLFWRRGQSPFFQNVNSLMVFCRIGILVACMEPLSSINPVIKTLLSMHDWYTKKTFFRTSPVNPQITYTNLFGSMMAEFHTILQWWGLFNRFPLFHCFMRFSSVLKHWVLIGCHGQIWLSCGDTFQISTSFEEFNIQFYDIPLIVKLLRHLSNLYANDMKNLAHNGGITWISIM